MSLSLLQEGRKIAVVKPIQTGFPQDTEFLESITGNKVPVFNTYSFSLPAAPSVAAEHEAKKIEIKQIISNIRKLEKEFDCVIVEGIGGIAVPIAENYLVADLIQDLNYPLLVASRATLGTINHTVLTIEFAKQKELDVLGFVISGYGEQTNDIVIKTAPDEISRITNLPCLFKLPILSEISYVSVSGLLANKRSLFLKCT